jgi:hypothetical protein
MKLIIFIIILLILIVIVNNYYEIKYFIELMNFNPKSKIIDINNNTFKKKLKILILSTDNRNTEYIQLHKKSYEDYSKNHNYTFLFEQPCNNLPIYYCKYQRILQLMEEYSNYDYFLWVDSDTIVNKKYISFPLENMIEQIGSDIDFIYTEFNLFKGILPSEITQKIFKAFIGGFYMFKNNQSVKNLLKNCIDYIDYSLWKNNYKGDCAYGGVCYEEAAIFYNIRDNTEINSTRLMGNFLYNGSKCYDEYFIIHDLTKSVNCFKKLI